jgi:hypothetical protein
MPAVRVTGNDTVARPLGRAAPGGSGDPFVVVLPCSPSASGRNVRHYKVQLLGRLKEYLHQTYCQRDSFVLGES